MRVNDTIIFPTMYYSSEAGYGRYDVIMIPQKKTKLELIMAFKRLDAAATETEMATAGENALIQIKSNHYDRAMTEANVKHIISLAIPIVLQNAKLGVPSASHL